MDQRVAIVKEIRAKLGCSLREAVDLYESQPHDWEAQVTSIAAGKLPWTSPTERVREHIRAYYAALDRGDHEEAAMRKAFSKIQITLGMFWTPKGDAMAVCKHCQAPIRSHETQWYSVAQTVLPQYCWVDPVHGSQLHEPKP